MPHDIARRPIKERFDHLCAVMSGQRFLQKQGLGNEVPFFICPYPPEEAVAMDRLRRQLTQHLEQKGVQVLEINLYDLAIELLHTRGIWEQILEVEPTVSKDELKELLQGVLDPESHLVPAIAEKLATHTFDILFLSGVGEVFPYIRSHNVLNNLQSTAKKSPLSCSFLACIPSRRYPARRWICSDACTMTSTTGPSTSITSKYERGKRHAFENHFQQTGRSPHRRRHQGRR